MFWKYNNNDSSKSTEELLNREGGVDLEEVLLSEDIIAQTRFNDNLLDYLLLPENLEKLINLSLFKTDLKESYKDSENRLSYLSGEILSFENWSICEAITDKEANLDKIWSFIRIEDKAENGTKLVTFCKLISCLFSKSEKAREYFKSHPELLGYLLNNLNHGPIQDLIQRMLQMADTRGNEESWFPTQSLVKELVEKIHPNKSVEEIEAANDLLIECMEFKPSNMEYSNLSFDDSRYAYIIKDLLREGSIDVIIGPMKEWEGDNFAFYLINTISMITELLRHIPSEKYLLQTSNQLVVSDFFNFLEKLNEILPKLINSLESHPYLQDTITNSTGTFKPLGIIRIKIIELISSITRSVHQLQHTPKSSPTLEKNESKLNLSTNEEPSLNLSISTISTRNNDSLLVLNSSQMDLYKAQKKDIINRTTSIFIETKLINTIIDLFFEYPWNNILHQVVYDIIHHLLHFKQSEFNDYQTQLLNPLLEGHSLFQRIAQAQKINDEKSAQFGGTRLGYMGYLTLITEDLLDFIQTMPEEVKPIVTKQIEEASWKHYIKETYFKLKENQEKLLGGKSIENIMHSNSTSSFQNETEFDSVSPYKSVIDEESDQSSDDDLHQFLSQYNNPADEEDQTEYFDGEYGWDAPRDIQNSFDQNSEDHIPFFIHSSSSEVEVTTHLSIDDDGADLSFGDSDPQDFFTDEVPLYEHFAKTVIHDAKFGSFGSASTPTSSSPPALVDEDENLSEAKEIDQSNYKEEIKDKNEPKEESKKED